VGEKSVPVKIVLTAVDRISAAIKGVRGAFDKLSKPVGNVRDALSGMGKGFGGVYDHAKKVGIGLTALGGAAAGAFYFLNRVSEKGDELAKESVRTGFGVEALQKWQYVAKMTGMTAEDFSGSLQTFTKNMGAARAGQGKLYGILAKVNPGFLTQLMAVKDNEKALEMMVGAIGKLQNPQARMALSMIAFGDAGAGMVNVAKEGTDSIHQMMREAAALGLMTAADAKRSEEFNDAFGRLKSATEGVAQSMAVALMPAITNAMGKLTWWLAGNRGAVAKWAREFAQKIPGAIKDVQARVNAFTSETWPRMKQGFADLRAAVEPALNALKPLVDRFGAVNIAAAALALYIGAPLLVPTLRLSGALVGLGGSVLGLVRPFKLIGGLLQLTKFGFGGLVQGFKWAGAAADVFGMAMRGGGTFMEAFAAVFPRFTVGITAIGRALMGLALANPVLTALVALLAGGAYLVIKNWDTVGPFLKDLWDDIKDAAGMAMDWMSEKVGHALEGVRGAFRSAGAWIDDHFGGVATKIKEAFGSALDWVKEKLSDLTGWLADSAPFQFLSDTLKAIDKSLDGAGLFKRTRARIKGEAPDQVAAAGGAPAAAGGFAGLGDVSAALGAALGGGFAPSFAPQAPAFGGLALTRTAAVAGATAPGLEGPAAGGETKIVVEFENMPPGTKVRTDKSGAVPVSLKLGYAMGGG
jgi:hypothetical protein